MRRTWLLCVVLAAPSADAQPGPPRSPRSPRPPAAPVRGDLWREITDPNGEQVRTLVAKARLSMRRADDALAGDTEWSVEPRARFYRDAYHLAAHARRLAPEHLEALAVFARAADELGKTAEAIRALELSIRLSGPDRAPVEVTGRLGALYLRLGDRDRAIPWLRHAQGPLAGGLDQAHALVHLAGALAMRGEPAAAAHALAGALPRAPLGGLSPEAILVTFALAVLHDREEQRASAFDVLDHLQTTLTAAYHEHVQVSLARMPFAPPEELHYFRALLYESVGHYVEARAEWLLYAAAGDPPYRGRALDHVAAIDAQRRANPGAKPPQQIAPPRAIPRRLPRP